MYNSDMEITLIYSRVILVNIVGEVYNPDVLLFQHKQRLTL